MDAVVVEAAGAQRWQIVAFLKSLQ